MMFPNFCQLAWPHTCVFFLLILYNFTLSTSKSSVSYSKHCGSVVSEATPTTYADFAFPYLLASTSFLAGGERILGKSPYSYLYSFDFHTSRNVYATNTQGVYKIEAVMTFRVYNHDVYYPESNATYGISPRRRRRSDRLKFLLHGFWSESSGKGCFVGSASWYSSKGETLNLEAKFNINYSKNSTYFNSLVTGNLESLSHLNDESYFEPISILSFPQVKQYEYKLISEETVRGFHVDDIEKSSVLESHPGEICSLFNMEYIPFNLEYASSCNSSVKNCSPVDGVLGYVPTSISLNSIQCEEYGNKMRFLARLTNYTYSGRYENFNPNSTLVGEGLWDEKTNSLVIVACRITSSNSSGDAHVGNCSYRLRLWFPSVWSIKNRDKAVGQIWTNKTAQDSGYFGRIKIRTSDLYMTVPGFKYEYTEIEKVNELCPKKAVTKGRRYPSEQSYDMRFDMSVQNSKYFGWGYAEPLLIGNKSYVHSPVYMSNSRWGGYGRIIESDFESENAVSDIVSLNVSYSLSFSWTGEVKLRTGYSSLNASLNSYGRLVISAEGIYDAETGYLCMVGCRDLGFNHSADCDILLSFQFPESEGSNEGFIKGSMKSTRKQSDPLFFEQLSIQATSFSSFEARRSVWRIDLEITMVLISNTLACISIFFQLYYAKKHPNTLPHISLVMLVILTLGNMIPLVLNFEALFLPKQNTENVMLSSAGWLEVNEVIVRVITMAAFLLQFRLLQSAWTARQSGESNKQDISVAEKKTLSVSLPIYIVGGLIAFLVNWKKNYYGNAPPAFDYFQAQNQQHTLWGDLRSYAGLILDGFLFPQVLLNIFQMSKDSALSMPFYLGTTLVHIVPHVYDIYRANNYVPTHVMRSYIYANPSADIYSTAWDIIIPLGGLLLAVIIFLQQKYGGRIILPRKLRELELYAKAPVDETVQ
ncbi:zf-RVT domain-containing protein [Heracleum sosnowskyi]|uniref:RING-type E3 ubiquitin transferase n=1 Tax=Heracleum sosnowskyi TaxID=360622 RepID=A0AAD8GUF9_9APIA|nr:zf-RVT domain-containing protein [Heracleum sosnowskyi]